MPNTEAVLPFTSMSRRSSLRTVGAAAAPGASAAEVGARTAIADPARVATPPAMTARRDSMGSLLEWVARLKTAFVDGYQISIPDGTRCDGRLLFGDEDAEADARGKSWRQNPRHS